MTSKIFILGKGIDVESFSRLKRFFRLCQMKSNDDKQKTCRLESKQSFAEKKKQISGVYILNSHTHTYNGL